MPNVVLLGDSSFDNAVYVGRAGVPVLGHLRARLPPPWKATLCAKDGATTLDVDQQLARIPEDATHLVVSVGGNNALLAAGVLREKARSVADVLERFHTLGATFERFYREMLDVVLARALPTGVCAIYNPAPPDPHERRLMAAGLQFFNDAILRVAFEHGLPVLDLRLTCADEGDLANPIEPSSLGGVKIADGIAQLVTTHDFAARRTTIYIGRAAR
jgi:GDSL-like Lipase/Acylhydrolase family